MQKIVALPLLLLLLAGCAAKKRTAKSAPAVVPPPPPIASASQPHAADDVGTSVAVFQHLLRRPENSVPDAILNRTQCIVVALAQGTRGVASCRHSTDPDHWEAPLLFRFGSAGTSGGNSDGDWLLFVLTQRAAEALRGGTLNLSQFLTAGGILLRQTPTITDADLNRDVVSYQLLGGGLNGASFGPAVLLIDRQANDEFYKTEQVKGTTRGDAVQSRDAQRFSDWVTSYFNAITPVGIILHHTAVVEAPHAIPTSVQEVDHFHQKRGFSIVCFGREYHVAYHYLIFPDGRIEAGRPERCEGAHARGYNAYLGISLVGDFSSTDNPDGKKGLVKPTPQQSRSLLALLIQLRRRYRIPLQRILRHADISPTACPGDRLPFRQMLLNLERSP